MTNKLTILAVTAIASFQAKAQCDTPTKYENDKYDYVYHWQDLKPTAEEIHTLSQYQESLIKLRCKLRESNKSRAYLSSLPKETQELIYIKSLLLKDGTVPVWKLITNSYSHLKSTENILSYLTDEDTTVSTLFKQDLKEYDALPAEYDKYLIKPDKGVMYKFLNYDWAEYNEPLLFQSGDTTQDVFAYCDHNAVDGMITWKNVPKVSFRFFINKEGVCSYVDHTTEQNVNCTKGYINKVQKGSIGIKFKPAIKDGANVDSYIEVSYQPYQFSQKEWKELQERKKAAKLEETNE